MKRQRDAGNRNAEKDGHDDHELKPAPRKDRRRFFQQFIMDQPNNNRKGERQHRRGCGNVHDFRINGENADAVAKLAENGKTAENRQAFEVKPVRVLFHCEHPFFIAAQSAVHVHLPPPHRISLSAAVIPLYRKAKSSIVLYYSSIVPLCQTRKAIRM